LAATALNQESLRQAFDAFNQQSSELEASYRELQGKVEYLTKQLRAAHDARHRELLENERLGSRLARLLEALPGAVIVLDGDGIIQQSNGRATELLNRPLHGCPWSEIVQREFRGGESANGELRLRDGRWLSLSRRRLVSEPGEILLLADVSESRHMAELLQRRERLSCIGEMTASLAHQIRTPLSSAMLYASQIAGESMPRDKLSTKITDSLQELGRMVEDMLRFAGGARRLNDTISVSQLLQDVVESFAPQQGASTLHVLQPDRYLNVDANRDAVKGALVNLVSNALQACGDSPRVELGAEKINGRICLTVSDNGHGIADDVRPHLFEAFYTTRPQGTGLGLAVVRAVAEAHCGEVLVDSRAGGTTFALCLPATGEST